MELEQFFDLPFPRHAVWAAFQDVPMLVSCFPGASLLSPPGVQPLEFAFMVKLGPINANFSGKGTIAYGSNFAGTLGGEGTDRGSGSRVKGKTCFELQDTETGTRVQLLIDYALTGALAQFGRPGIVKEIASGITRQFAANLRAALQSRVAPQAVCASVDGELTLRAQPAKQFDGTGLLLGILWMRVKRLFGLS